MPAGWQAEAWDRLRAQLEGERISDGEMSIRPRPRVRARRHADTDDDLRAVPPTEYVERLTGWEVPRSGFILCAFPDHDERTPSMKVWDDPERGVWCWGCNRGGDIFRFASYLWGLDCRRDFREITTRLREVIG